MDFSWTKIFGNKKYLFLSLLGVYIVFLIIGALSTELGKTIPQGIDKIIHFVEFFILFILIYLNFWAFGFGPSKVVFTFIISTIIGLLSEIMQLFTKTRTFSWEDFLADILGILVAMTIMVVFEWKFMKR